MKWESKGLLRILSPHITFLQFCGHFVLDFHTNKAPMLQFFRGSYSVIQISLTFLHMAFCFLKIFFSLSDLTKLVPAVVTTMLGIHGVIKLIYVASRRKRLARTLRLWDEVKTHPIFERNDEETLNRTKRRAAKWLIIAAIFYAFFSVAWIISPIFDSGFEDIIVDNVTMTVEKPRLIVGAWYPMNLTTSPGYQIAYMYQMYWAVFCPMQVYGIDILFCCLLVHASEQLKHLKQILIPLVEMSSNREGNPSAKSKYLGLSQLSLFQDNSLLSELPRRRQVAWSNNKIYVDEILNNDNNLNAETGASPGDQGMAVQIMDAEKKKTVRSAIKYWVERHRQIIRFTVEVEDMYGVALLLHILLAAMNLCILAFESSQIRQMNIYSINVLGFMIQNLLHIFVFCIEGNNLMEESSSLMRSVYDSSWYAGSEEAKVFIQIVSQQCQRPLSISGAKFFTLSFDFFGSVLGAVITYFIVLVQMK